MKKLYGLIIFTLILFTVSGCQKDKQNEAEISNICAYVKEIKDGKILIDPAEYISSEDSERISELNLDESDLINGYYIHNAEYETKEYLLTENTEYNFIDWHNLFVPEGSDRNYSTQSTEDFIKYIDTYENAKPGMPFFFELSENEVLSIKEEPMM